MIGPEAATVVVEAFFVVVWGVLFLSISRAKRELDQVQVKSSNALLREHYVPQDPLEYFKSEYVRDRMSVEEFESSVGEYLEMQDA